MNYFKIYDSLISRAKSRSLEGYKERHHIVPRCLGGSNDKTNLVDLTAREHYIAHQLLVMMYPSHQGLISAVAIMCSSNKHQIRSNRMYSWIRERQAKRMSDMMKGRTSNRKGIKTNKPSWNTGITMSDSTRQKMSDTWEITSPSGIKYTVSGLKDFCSEHNLNPSAMVGVCKGRRSHHKGYTCKKLTNVTIEDNKQYISKPNKGWTVCRTAKPVIINGTEYRSIQYACEVLGLTRNEVKKLNEH